MKNQRKLQKFITKFVYTSLGQGIHCPHVPGSHSFLSQSVAMHTFLVTLLLISCSCANGNQYDPHIMPETGPFFEGWYLRLIDPSQNRSFGVLFGAVTPASQSAAANLTFIGLLRSFNQGQRLEDYNAFPNPSDVIVTVKDGLPVVNNPDRESPANFNWSYPGGYVRVQPDNVTINIVVGNVHFRANIGAPVPWGPDGVGPMANWDDYMSFPLYWFVYSLQSPILSYEWTDEHTHLSGNSGIVHMEKNWGDTFPEGWIWSEGYSAGESVTYALTYGPINILKVVDLSGFLFGYRNHVKGINLNFRPDNARMSQNVDGCSGASEFTFTGLSNKLILSVVSAPGNYSECLYGPMENGFRPVCKETFIAKANVQVFKRHFLSWTQIDQQALQGVALEFGGHFTCNGVCQIP